MCARVPVCTTRGYEMAAGKAEQWLHSVCHNAGNYSKVCPCSHEFIAPF